MCIYVHIEIIMIIKVEENFGSDLPFLVKLHEIWSVGSHENH